MKCSDDQLIVTTSKIIDYVKPKTSHPISSRSDYELGTKSFDFKETRTLIHPVYSCSKINLSFENSAMTMLSFQINLVFRRPHDEAEMIYRKANNWCDQTTRTWCKS